MPRTPRRQSEADVYHVFARGVGRQIIFEDDVDRRLFLKVLGEFLSGHEGDLLAWVLMSNHFHLLFQMPLKVLSDCMMTLQRTYARHFNARHDRVGHLFQGRFGSQPITSDEQLMSVVRYIHRNPIKAGLSKTCDYKWSSYRSYLKQNAAVTNVDFVTELFGDVARFVDFNEKPDDKRFSFLDIDESDGDSKLQEKAIAILGEDWRSQLSGDDREKRDMCLRRLKDAGLSIRQIERLTGIGRGIIVRA